jgi:hypothetical protein
MEGIILDFRFEQRKVHHNRSRKSDDEEQNIHHVQHINQAFSEEERNVQECGSMFEHLKVLTTMNDQRERKEQPSTHPKNQIKILTVHFTIFSEQHDDTPLLSIRTNLTISHV